MTVLNQTRELIERYGAKLIDGSISDEELRTLSNSFSQSPGYADPSKPVSNDNFSKIQGIQNFIQVIGPQIPKNTLRYLNTKLLELSFEDSTGFLRNTSFFQQMTAFEFARFPDNKESYYNKAFQVKGALPKTTDKENFETGTIKGSIDFYGKILFNQYYPHAIHSKANGRSHLFAASAEGFRSIKREYTELKGDYLKTMILKDFKSQLESCTDKESLAAKINELKSSDEYKILAKGQGLFTRMFNLETSSIKAFNAMVKDQTDLINSPRAPSPK